jgi:hypothetical protein
MGKKSRRNYFSTPRMRSLSDGSDGDVIVLLVISYFQQWSNKTGPAPLARTVLWDF